MKIILPKGMYVYFTFFFSGKPADLYDKTHPAWAPTLKLDILTTRKSSKKVKKVETDLKR